MPTWVRTIVLNWLAKVVRVKVPPGLINVIEKHVQDQEEALEEIQHERRNSILPPPITRRERCLTSLGDYYSKSRGSLFSTGRNRCRTLSSERGSSFTGEASSTLGPPKLHNLPYASSLRSINEERRSTAPDVPSSFETTMKEMLLKQDNLLKNVRRLVYVARENEENEIKKEEWKIVASVIDACFFWVFMAALLVSSLVIFLQAPSY